MADGKVIRYPIRLDFDLEASTRNIDSFVKQYTSRLKQMEKESKGATSNFKYTIELIHELDAAMSHLQANDPVKFDTLFKQFDQNLVNLIKNMTQLDGKTTSILNNVKAEIEGINSATKLEGAVKNVNKALVTMGKAPIFNPDIKVDDKNFAEIKQKLLSALDPEGIQRAIVGMQKGFNINDVIPSDYLSSYEKRIDIIKTQTDRIEQIRENVKNTFGGKNFKIEKNSSFGADDMKDIEQYLEIEKKLSSFRNKDGKITDKMGYLEEYDKYTKIVPKVANAMKTLSENSAQYGNELSKVKAMFANSGMSFNTQLEFFENESQKLSGKSLVRNAIGIATQLGNENEEIKIVLEARHKEFLKAQEDITELIKAQEDLKSGKISQSDYITKLSGLSLNKDFNMKVLDGISSTDAQAIANAASQYMDTFNVTALAERNASDALTRLNEALNESQAEVVETAQKEQELAAANNELAASEEKVAQAVQQVNAVEQQSNIVAETQQETAATQEKLTAYEALEKVLQQLSNDYDELYKKENGQVSDKSRKSLLDKYAGILSGSTTLDNSTINGMLKGAIGTDGTGRTVAEVLTDTLGNLPQAETELNKAESLEQSFESAYKKAVEIGKKAATMFGEIENQTSFIDGSTTTKAYKESFNNLYKDIQSQAKELSTKYGTAKSKATPEYFNAVNKLRDMVLDAMKMAKQVQQSSASKESQDIAIKFFNTLKAVYSGEYEGKNAALGSLSTGSKAVRAMKSAGEKNLLDQYIKVITSKTADKNQKAEGVIKGSGLDIEKSINDMLAKLKEATSELKEARKEVKDITKAKEKIQKDLEKAKQDVNKKSQELSSKNKSYNDLTEAKKANEATIKEQNAKIEELTAENEALKKGKTEEEIKAATAKPKKSRSKKSTTTTTETTTDATGTTKSSGGKGGSGGGTGVVAGAMMSSADGQNIVNAINNAAKTVQGQIQTSAGHIVSALKDDNVSTNKPNDTSSLPNFNETLNAGSNNIVNAINNAAQTVANAVSKNSNELASVSSSLKNMKFISDKEIKNLGYTKAQSGEVSKLKLDASKRITNEYDKLSAEAGKTVSHIGNEVQIANMRALQSGIIKVTGAVKDANGVWQGFTTNIDKSNKATLEGINANSGYAKKLQSLDKAAMELEQKRTKLTSEIKGYADSFDGRTKDGKNIKGQLKPILDEIANADTKKLAELAKSFDAVKKGYTELQETRKKEAQAKTDAYFKQQREQNAKAEAEQKAQTDKAQKLAQQELELEAKKEQKRRELAEREKAENEKRLAEQRKNSEERIKVEQEFNEKLEQKRQEQQDIIQEHLRAKAEAEEAARKAEDKKNEKISQSAINKNLAKYQTEAGALAQTLNADVYNTKKVKDLEDRYKTAYNKVAALGASLPKDSPLNAQQAEQWRSAVAEMDKYKKELNSIIVETEKLRNIPSGKRRTMSEQELAELTASGEYRKKLVEFAQATRPVGSTGAAEIKAYNEELRQLEYTIQNSDNTLTTYKAKLSATGNELIAVAIKTEQMKQQTSEADKEAQKLSRDFNKAQKEMQKEFAAQSEKISNSPFYNNKIGQRLSGLRGQMASATTVEELEKVRAGINAINNDLGKAQDSVKNKVNGIKNSVNAAFKTVDFKKDTANLNTEQQAIVDKYTRLIDLTNQFKADGSNASMTVARSIQQLGKELTNDIKLYNEANGIINANGGRTKAAPYALNVSKADVRAAGIQNAISGTDSLATSNIVNIKLEEYINALQRLKDIQSQFKIGEVLSPEQKTQFGAAEKQVNALAKELEKLISSVTTLREESARTAGANASLGIDDSTVVRTNELRAAMEQLARQTYGNATVSIGEFNDRLRELSFTVNDNKGSISDMRAVLSQAGNEIYLVADSTRQTTGTLANFANMVKTKFASIGSYLMASFGYYRVFSEIRKGIGYVKEIDAALTEVRKVTNETDATYKEFVQDMAKVGSVVGATTSSLVNSAADWARLGYSIQEAGELAKNTAILMNVSEFDNINDATDAMISALKAFNYEAKDSLHVVDIFNTIGNNFAISTSDLASSLTSSASALTTAGVDLEQASALLTGANTIMQDPDSVNIFADI